MRYTVSYKDLEVEIEDVFYEEDDNGNAYIEDFIIGDIKQDGELLDGADLELTSAELDLDDGFHALLAKKEREYSDDLKVGEELSRREHYDE
jgi:hypothetical protein